MRSALSIIFPPLIRQMLLNSTRGDRPSIVLVNEVESIRLERGGRRGSGVSLHRCPLLSVS